MITPIFADMFRAVFNTKKDACKYMSENDIHSDIEELSNGMHRIKIRQTSQDYKTELESPQSLEASEQG